MLRFRLNVGLLAVLALMTVVALAGWALMGKVDAAVGRILGRHLPTVTAIQAIRSGLARINSLYLSLPLREFAAAERVTFRTEYQRIKDLAANLSRLSAGTSHAPATEIFTRDLDAYLAMYENFLALSPPNAEDHARLISLIAARNVALNRQAEDLVRQIDFQMRRAQGQASEFIRDTRMFSSVALILALGLTALHFIRFNRLVADPIERLTKALRQAGEGHLESELPVRADDELGQLATEFNRMRERLLAYRESTGDEILRLNTLLRRLVAAFPDPIFILDADGSRRLANPAAEEFALAIGGDNGIPPALAAAVAETLRTGEVAVSLPASLTLRVRAEERCYVPKLIPILDGTRRISVAVVLDDITRLRLRDDLKTRFLATISHELKTPLTGIQMAVHLLAESASAALSPSQVELIATARRDTDRLLRLLHNLLEMARYDHGHEKPELAPCTPSRLCAEAADIAEATLESRRQSLIINAPDNLPFVLADPFRLCHVFKNLLENASKFSPHHSAIELDAREEGSRILFTVKDCGPGVPEDEREHIFEKFYRARGQKRSGTGLGLAIAREIVTLHEGVIGCENLPQGGACFWFSLPQAPAPSDGKPPTASPARAAA